MSVAVCLALSLKLLHNFTEVPAVVTAFVVDLATFFFPLPKGLIAFPLSLVFLPCPSGTAFETWGLGVGFATCHYDRSWQCNRSVCGCSYHSLQIFIPSPIGPFKVFLPI